MARTHRASTGQGRPTLAGSGVYVRDDKPFGGPAPPRAVFYYSRDRAGQHPQAHLANYGGIFQADAYDGYRKLYGSVRAPGQILKAACWVHARRPFFVMADLGERQSQGARQEAGSDIALSAGGGPAGSMNCSRSRG